MCRGLGCDGICIYIDYARGCVGADSSNPEGPKSSGPRGDDNTHQLFYSGYDAWHYDSSW